MIRISSRSQLLLALVAVVVIALVLLKILGDRRTGSDEALRSRSLEGVSTEAMMQRGLDLLYGTRDPSAAAETFREVLKQRPTHYGAHFQLAVALDLAGRPDEARPLWEEVLRMAESTQDEPTALIARKRLEIASEERTEEQLMKEGLDLLYTRGDPATAAEQFRKVLAKNPSHYGAHYQLAVALDRAGRPEEARPWWEKVLRLAEGHKDQTTAGTAHARLQRRP